MLHCCNGCAIFTIAFKLCLQLCMKMLQALKQTFLNTSFWVAYMFQGWVNVNSKHLVISKTPVNSRVGGICEFVHVDNHLTIYIIYWNMVYIFMGRDTEMELSNITFYMVNFKIFSNNFFFFFSLQKPLAFNKILLITPRRFWHHIANKATDHSILIKQFVLISSIFVFITIFGFLQVLVLIEVVKK